MKAHIIDLDAESGLAHGGIGTAANMADTDEAQSPLHGGETDAYAEVGYQGIHKRSEQDSVRWHVATRPSKRTQLNLNDRLDAKFDWIERLKAGIVANVEYPFRVLKQQLVIRRTDTAVSRKTLRKSLRWSRRVPCAWSVAN